MKFWIGSSHNVHKAKYTFCGILPPYTLPVGNPEGTSHQCPSWLTHNFNRSSMFTAWPYCVWYWALSSDLTPPFYTMKACCHKEYSTQECSFTLHQILHTILYAWHFYVCYRSSRVASQIVLETCGVLTSPGKATTGRQMGCEQLWLHCWCVLKAGWYWCCWRSVWSTMMKELFSWELVPPRYGTAPAAKTGVSLPHIHYCLYF